MHHKIMLSLIVSVLIFSACSAVKTMENKNTNSIFWVNSMKTECMGVAPMQCLLIHRGEDLKDSKWELFYTDIEGFNFVSGYFQKIEVKEEQLENVPADASSIKYTLVKTLKKEIDNRFRLNDIWVPKRIDGNDVEKKEGLPRMEIHLSKMQILGTNGCNRYSGKIERVTDSEIQFRNIASTKKMCMDMSIANTFDNALSKTVAYKLGNLELNFYDKEGNELISFFKID